LYIAETLRLWSIINGVKVCEEFFADYIGYWKLEVKIEEIIRELEHSSPTHA